MVPGVREMGSLVGAMLQEWEVAMHKAAVANAAQSQAQARHWGEQQQKVLTLSTEGPKENVGGESAKELHIVQDLVQNIKDKPQGKAAPQEEEISQNMNTS
jgi:hypothetical protein